MRKKPGWLKTHGITVEEDVWNQAAVVLKQVGMNRSQYVNLVLKYLVKSQTVNMMEVQEGLFKDMYDSVLKAKEIETERIGRVKPASLAGARTRPDKVRKKKNT